MIKEFSLKIFVIRLSKEWNLSSLSFRIKSENVEIKSLLEMKREPITLTQEQFKRRVLTFAARLSTDYTLSENNDQQEKMSYFIQ